MAEDTNGPIQCWMQWPSFSLLCLPSMERFECVYLRNPKAISGFARRISSGHWQRATRRQDFRKFPFSKVQFSDLRFEDIILDNFEENMLLNMPNRAMIISVMLQAFWQHSHMVCIFAAIEIEWVLLAGIHLEVRRRICGWDLQESHYREWSVVRASIGNAPVAEMSGHQGQGQTQADSRCKSYWGWIAVVFCLLYLRKLNLARTWSLLLGIKNDRKKITGPGKNEQVVYPVKSQKWWQIWCDSTNSQKKFRSSTWPAS